MSEIVRVLRPGGAFLFQFNSLTAPTMNLKGRIAWSVVDAFWSLGFIRFSRRMAAVFGFDPLTAGRAWRGSNCSWRQDVRLRSKCWRNTAGNEE